MEPVVGVEPTTYGLQNRCSTTELNWPQKVMRKFLVSHQKHLPILVAPATLASQFADRPVFQAGDSTVARAQGAITASPMPWTIFLSAGTMVARMPPSAGRAASPSPLTK